MRPGRVGRKKYQGTLVHLLPGAALSFALKASFLLKHLPFVTPVPVGTLLRVFQRSINIGTGAGGV